MEGIPTEYRILILPSCETQSVYLSSITSSGSSESLHGYTGLNNPVELYFTRQSGYMSISEVKDVPVQPPSGPYEACVVFAGVGLQESALKLWLEDCRGEVRYTNFPILSGALNT